MLTFLSAVIQKYIIRLGLKIIVNFGSAFSCPHYTNYAYGMVCICIFADMVPIMQCQKSLISLLFHTSQWPDLWALINLSSLTFVRDLGAVGQIHGLQVVVGHSQVQGGHPVLVLVTKARDRALLCSRPKRFLFAQKSTVQFTSSWHQADRTIQIRAAVIQRCGIQEFKRQRVKKVV